MKFKDYQNLFPTLQVLADKDAGQSFLILGSASRDLIRQSLETLTGIISYIACIFFLFLTKKKDTH
ncbi:hypothetical protein [Rickettsia canadensis]|uniref:NADH dehydrogenase subunit M n=1 Tax=Rickettsia canadensis str. CA410 TaxID=1105107 RepID=A0ABM5MUD5_RICCA|nr:hypothetical protein [Rickettsia canadensis]AFB21487.1 NADH dehydrogenase subunit M [Rickettsia canadensis str. CA410]